MKRTFKELEPSNTRSIVRVIWVKMKEWEANTLKDQKEVCKAVLDDAIENHYIQVHTAEYMKDKIKGMRSISELQRYLVNSKNYFEKNFVYTNA